LASPARLMTEKAEPMTRGRPRSDRSRQAALSAAFTILVELGYEQMSIEGVASAAGIGKSTIYRWWSGKAELAIEAFFEGTKDGLGFPETGSAREDFRLQISALADFLRNGRGRVLAAMLGGARSDPELAKTIGERFLAPRQRWGAERMARAIAAGETRPGIKPGPALGLLYGPIYTPLLFGRDVPGAADVAAHLDLALGAVFAPGSPSDHAR